MSATVIIEFIHKGLKDIDQWAVHSLEPGDQMLKLS